MTTRPEPIDQLVSFLGALGPRWGLPAEACRVHGYLFLVSRSVTESELGKELRLAQTVLSDALAWLVEYGLVERAGPKAWKTEADPWDLVIRALNERRKRELTPALDLLRVCYRAVQADGQDVIVHRQIGKLLALAEDIAAIDTQTRRLSPKTLRRIVGIGGRAARFVDQTFGRRSRT